MKRLEVLSYLGQVKEAREEFARAQTKFVSDVDAVMNRLIHEGARALLSAEEIARAAGMPTKRVRAFMRSNGLAPSDSKTLLSKKAAEALANNAALLGIEPSEMDLMSPLAYLPMGEKMKRELQQTSQVTEFPETEYVLVRIDRETWEEHQENGECPVSSACCGCHLDYAQAVQ